MNIFYRPAQASSRSLFTRCYARSQVKTLGQARIASTPLVISRSGIARGMTSQPNWEITDSVKQNPLLAATMEAMRRIAPLQLAETSFDNVGVLLQAPPQPQPQSEKQGVMLAIDLTTEVCDEILSSPNNIKVALVYHPIIFRGLKSITCADPQQTSLLRLASAGVSVYCPHTSLDAAPGGINDWLGRVISDKEKLTEFDSDDRLHGFRSHVYPFCSPAKNVPKGFESAGMGRLIELDEAQTFEEIVKRVKQNLDLPYVQGCKASDKKLSKIAVCAGSGSSVFSGVKADLCKCFHSVPESIICSNSTDLATLSSRLSPKCYAVRPHGRAFTRKYSLATVTVI